MHHAYIASLLLFALALPAAAATCAITPAPDGGMQFANDVMALRTAPEAASAWA